MIDNAGKTTDKVAEKGPTPFTTMYYNDPQYIDKFPGSILDKNPRNSLNNQVNGRVGNNGLIATSENQQSANSLVQNVTQNPLGPEQVSRPATKDDFVMHTVRPSDTLERICIQYNVNKDAIRMANGFLGEEIYMFKTLKIPYTFGEVYHVPEDKDWEEKQRQWAIEQFHQTVRDVNRNNQNYESEVKFYLEMNNYDMEKAMQEYEEDMKFEKKVISDNKRYLREKRRQRFNDIGCN